MVQIVEVGRIGPHAGHVAADQLDGFVQRVLVSARDEDVSSFVVDELTGRLGRPSRPARSPRAWKSPTEHILELPATLRPA